MNTHSIWDFNRKLIPLLFKSHLKKISVKVRTMPNIVCKLLDNQPILIGIPLVAGSRLKPSAEMWPYNMPAKSTITADLLFLVLIVLI